MTTTWSFAVAFPEDGHGAQQLHEAQGQSTRLARDVAAQLTRPARTPRDGGVDSPGPRLIPLRFLTAIITPLYQPTHTARTRHLPGSALRVPFHSNSQDPGKCTTRNHCGRKPGWFKTRYRLPWLALLGWRASSSLFFLFPRWPAFPARSYIFPSVCACCSVKGREKRHSGRQVIVARTGLGNPWLKRQDAGKSTCLTWFLQTRQLFKGDCFLLCLRRAKILLIFKYVKNHRRQWEDKIYFSGLFSLYEARLE